MVPNKRLNILFTSTYFYPYLSGLTDYPLAIGEFLAAEHRVSTLTFQHRKNLLLFEKHRGISITRLPVQIKIFKGLWSWFYPLKIWRMVQKADVIFINLPQFEGFFPAFAGRMLGKRTYAIYHCELAFNRGWRLKMAAFAGNLSAFLTCLLVTKVIAYTQDYAAHSAILRYFLAKAVYVLPPVKRHMGDQGYEGYLKKIINDRKPVIGFAGRIAQEKGMEYLLKALMILKERRKEFNDTVLLIAGPFGKEVAGEARYYGQILEIITKNNLAVYFLGALTKAQLFTFYRQIDLLVLPSINKTEAFGMVQVQAMLSGTPVVASDLPGVRQPILLTKMGLLAAPCDSDDLADKIQLVLGRYEQFTRHAKIAEEHFRVEKTRLFYQKLLQ